MRELATPEVPDTVGKVTVELVDVDTGRVTYRETKDNFLSMQSKEVARWWQRYQWGYLSPVETRNAAGYLPSEMPWFPADHIGYWNDATAESASTEVNVAQPLVGWASRLPVGSPSGKRGLVNISESEFTDSYAKWVFDWVTSQGNGTFQSVGWTRVHETNGFPLARFPEPDQVTLTGTTFTSSFVPRVSLAYASSKFYVIDSPSSSSVRVMSAATTGGSASIECTLASWTTPAHVYGLAVSGTDFYVSGTNGSGSALLRKHSSTGTATWSKTGETSVTYQDVTVDGSGKVWTAGSDGVMRRHSATDGTVEATVSPTLAPTALRGIAYDSTDSNFWIGGTFAGATGVVKVDASGNTVSNPMGLNLSGFTVVATAPFSGSYTVPASAGRDTFLFTHNGSYGGADTAYRSPSNTTALGNGYALAVGAAGVLYVGHTASSSAGTQKVSSLKGYTLGSRVKLSAPVTKTSAQSLKITYQLDFV